jgi:hypothetical protein
MAGAQGFRLALPPGEPEAPSPTFTEGLERYVRGDRQAASAFNCNVLVTSDVVADAGRWITAAGKTAAARTTAAAFAIETAWACSHTAAYEGRRLLDPARIETNRQRMTLFRPVGIGPLVAWVMDTMPADASHALAQAWWPAAMGVLQKSAHWKQTLDELPRARVRAPGPRWRLVNVVARVGRDLPAPTGGHSNRFDVLSATSRQLSSGDARRATEWLDALHDDPALAAEADVRAGYIAVRRRDWNAALARLGRVGGATSDPFLSAAADYLAGWAHEQLNQSSQAVAAYERALAFEPEMRNVATLLAAQLFLSDRRDEAHPILERALGSTRQPADLVTTLEHGDARFVAGHLDAMRRALR